MLCSELTVQHQRSQIYLKRKLTMQITYCVVARADATYVATFKSNDVAALGP